MPQPAYQAIQLALAATGKELATMKPEESLWPYSANSERGVTSGSFYGNLRRYFKAAGLPKAGVHIFRRSAAKLRRDATRRSRWYSLEAMAFQPLGNWQTPNRLPQQPTHYFRPP